VTLRKSVIFEGRHGVRSAFFHMAPGCVIPRHTHSKWVQVMVLKGQEPERSLARDPKLLASFTHDHFVWGCVALATDESRHHKVT
jgi:hypothetical protein